MVAKVSCIGVELGGLLPMEPNSMMYAWLDASNMTITMPYFILIGYFIHAVKALPLLYNKVKYNFVYQPFPKFQHHWLLHFKSRWFLSCSFISSQTFEGKPDNLSSYASNLFSVFL